MGLFIDPKSENFAATRIDEFITALEADKDSQLSDKVKIVNENEQSDKYYIIWKIGDP